MFANRKEPFRPATGQLLEVRFSLNAPTIRSAELPAGPARAAIVVHSERGQQHLAVAVRSLEKASVAVYQLGEPLGDRAQAVDAALSFGESMGFLFDDDALLDGSGDARAKAAERLQALLEEVPAGPVLAVEEAAGEELWLHALADEAAPPQPSAPATPSPSAAALPLTKFRSAAQPPAVAAPSARPAAKRRGAGGRAVGLVQLVRRVTRRKEAPPGDFLELLGQF